MAGACPEQEGALLCGRKVFFLYPHSVLNEDLLVQILSNEYEIYSLHDHHVAERIARAFPGSIFFLNIDEALKERQWALWIRGLLTDPATVSTRIGILTYNPDPELARKYLMEIGIPCGFIQMKLGLAEGKSIILKMLAANEAKGRRRYVRARCSDGKKASFNLTVRGAHVTGDIVDISVAGMSVRFDATVRFKDKEVLDDVQLRMRGTLCRVAGTYAGILGERSDRSLLLFNAPLAEDAQAKIHRFIFLSLQEEMSDYIRTLPV
jgi:hypothetical protein